MARKPARGGGPRDLRKDILQGIVLGALLYAALYDLRIPKAFLEFDSGWGIAAAAAIGAALCVMRFGNVLWVLGGLTAVLFALVAMTPIFPRAAWPLIRADRLRKADAVIVLGSSTTREGKLDHIALMRMVDGMRLVHEGWAPTLVRTEIGGDYPSPKADVAQLAEVCGRPKIEVIGPVFSTRDEAMKFAMLAEKRGWKSVIIVTSPYHTARAAAVFRKLGLDVIAYPCVEREFSPSRPRGTRERMEVFRWWLYEELRWALYRARGWI